MEGDLCNPDNHGVIPRSARAIFENLKSPQYSNHAVTCSYLEIYNEDLGDLLSDGSNKVTMMEGKNGVVCRGLSEERVDSAADVLNLMNRAQHRRHIGETKMNKQSSRSHCIFTIKVSASVQVPDGTVTLEGKLHMVDLAGSENAKTAGGDKTIGSEAARERERMSINRSLLTLGRVISILKEQSQSKKSSKNIRIPYRDSKLTRILQESLGGRCKTVIIATLSPSITAIEESMSTLNYAQSANGIINKPVSTSFMAAGGSGLMSGSSTPSKSGGITTESWHEMECRLQYMQTQVEEAQAALGRKHMQQVELVERAEKAEQEVTDREVRIGLMEKEMNAVKNKLSNEIEQRRSAEAKRRDAEYTLKKTAAILLATQQTECALTSEATTLLQALKDAVADGEALHRTIIECKDVEMERQAAAKSFRQAALEVLEESVESLGGLARKVDEHAETLMNSASQGYDQQNSSLAATEALIKSITDKVKSVTDTVSKQLLGNNGIVLLLRDITSSIDAGSSAATNAISGGESSLEASCTLARQKFVEHGQRLKELQVAYADASSESITVLENNVTDNKAKIEGMVESASRALHDAKNVRTERIKTMSQLILGWEEASLHASNHISSAATSESSTIGELLAFMETERARHDTTRTILSEQKAFIDASEAAHIDSLSSQSSLLSTQQELIAQAQTEKKKIREDIMKTIMGGVQELVSQQMQRLAHSDEEHLSGMISSNRSVHENNAALIKSTGATSEKLRNSNSALLKESEKVRENDMHAKKVIEDTGNVLGEILEFASKNATATTSYSDKARNSVMEMQKCDKESEKILKEIKSDGQKCAKHIETIHNQTKKDMVRLAFSSNQISTFASDTIIPDAFSTIDTVQESRKEPVQLFNKHMSDIIESTAIGAKKINEVSQMQVDAAKNLCTIIQEKSQDFTNDIAQKQQASIESRKEELIQLAKSHSTSLREKIASAEEQSRDVAQRIGNYAAFADVEVSSAPAKKTYKYSASLTATPAHEVILRDANIQEEHHTESNDEEPMKSDEKCFKDDEECSSQTSQSASHISQDTMNTSIESDGSRSLSPPQGLKEVAVNKSSSTTGTSNGQKQSAIPRPTVKRTNSSSRSRSANSPAISRKRAKTSRHGPSTPRGSNRINKS